MDKELIDFSVKGNIIPPIWYKRITFANGKPQLLAINILADLVYWYRPIEIRDEHTGQVIERRKKFKTDILQRGYKQICEFFGCSKDQAKDSLQLLEKMGLIERIVRSTKIGEMTIPSCLYIKLNVDAVKKISFLTQEELTKNLNASKIEIEII